MLCVIMFISRSVGSQSGRYFVKQQITLGKMNGFIEEMISGQKVVKVFNHEEEAIKDSVLLMKNCVRAPILPTSLPMF